MRVADAHAALQQIVRFLTRSDDIVTVRHRSTAWSDDANRGDYCQFQEFSARSEKLLYEWLVLAREYPQQRRGDCSRFQRRFIAQAPVSRADVQPTPGQVMKMKMPSLGALRRRVITEAPAGGPPRFRTALRVADRWPCLDEACLTKAAACE